MPSTTNNYCCDEITQVGTEVNTVGSKIEDNTAQLAILNSQISVLNFNLENISIYIQKYYELANTTGIRIRPTNSEGFSRAMIVNALKESNQLQNVIDEYNNPTPVPGLD